MIFAVANGVPEAGIAFALAMMMGVTATLSLVALVTVGLRDWAVAKLAQHGAQIARIIRFLDGTTGVLLLGIGAWSLLR